MGDDEHDEQWILDDETREAALEAAEELKRFADLASKIIARPDRVRADRVFRADIVRQHAEQLIRACATIYEQDDVVMLDRSIAGIRSMSQALRAGIPDWGEPDWESLAAQLAHGRMPSAPLLAVRLRNIPGVLANALKTYGTGAPYRRAMVDLLQELGDERDEETLKKHVARRLRASMHKID